LRKLIVVVNKMDSVNYSETRFNEVKTEVSKIMTKIGFTNASSVQKNNKFFLIFLRHLSFRFLRGMVTMPSKNMNTCHGPIPPY
jgi:Ni2+-binding GTPase involved in maturation of urease and hydrogenase